MNKMLCVLYIGFMTVQMQAQLVTWETLGIKHNDDYTVRVREVGGEWKDLYEYNVNVDMDNVQNASMVQFDMGSPVEVMVKKNNGLIQEAQIRPLSKGITCKVNRNVIIFTLDKPQYLSVEFNGDRLHNLHLFANPLETETYKKSADNVIYFGPGIHRPKDLPNDRIRIPANTTVYLAPGALLKAALVVDHAENVRIIGRGFLHNTIRGVEVTKSKNIIIDGITVINPDHYTVFGGECDGLEIRNLKSFSSKGWSDGIDMMSCKNVNINNIFLRNSDDCIALYCHRWDFYGDCRNVNVNNAVLWADVAHPINLGGHGNFDGTPGDVIENIAFRDIDILEHDEDDIPYQGCMAIDVGDKNLAHNILFENIRIESIQEGRLFHLNVRFNAKYDKQPGRGIDGVTFRNITYNGTGENSSWMKGFDVERCIRNVIFENVIINGEKMRNTKDFLMNEFVTDVNVK